MKNSIMLVCFLCVLLLLSACQAAPADRETTFPGAGGVTLKGSVLKGGAHPFFAVLVAGSGPTDRNWSSPLMGTVSHAGREIARWLQARGIGSLRFDKRFIGVNDPGMDVGFAAQTGDIRAAVAQARTLPEAAGKKILLVGHSEGTMMALAAQTDAEAVLLLAPPAKPMGPLVRDQLARQLAKSGADEATTRANLAHLDAVYAAIREGKTAPPPAGPGVAPGVAQLGMSLMAGQTLAFVRDTFDLDHWPLAAAFKGPIAAVWAAADIQCPPPAAKPAGFPGPVITIRQANHLLRRETRDPATLTGQDALGTYGDDTPLADLAPLAAWLAGLR